MRKITCGLSTFGFEGIPAPMVQVYCYLLRIEHGEWVRFLIDTGASETCLNGKYALGLQSSLQPQTLRESYGIGGRCGYYTERALFVFRADDGKPLFRQINIGIQQIQPPHSEDPDCLQCPSLLGRDILNEWAFKYDVSAKEISLVVP